MLEIEQDFDVSCWHDVKDHCCENGQPIGLEEPGDVLSNDAPSFPAKPVNIDDHGSYNYKDAPMILLKTFVGGSFTYMPLMVKEIHGCTACDLLEPATTTTGGGHARCLTTGAAAPCVSFMSAFPLARLPW